MNIRNTKQKQIIMEVLDQNRIHPTIKEILEKVKEVDPSIGQATIYRNINRLVDEKKVTKISTMKGIDCYDINVNPHYHLLCKKCNNLIDLFDDEYLNMISKIEKNHNIMIENSNIVFNGICNDCLQIKNDVLGE